MGNAVYRDLVQALVLVGVGDGVTLRSVGRAGGVRRDP